MSTSINDIALTVSFRGASHPISVSPAETLETLQTRLEHLTSVPVHLQKLLYKGKKNVSPEYTLLEAGLRDGMKVQMLGSTAQELGGLKAIEDEQRRRDEILRQRALKAPTKVRSTASSSTDNLRYRFHEIQPLPYLPDPPQAKVVLERLASDPAIIHIMRKHKFSVGLLTELAPHEHPELLGLNENAGQAIKLRLRTNAYDGFRLYKDVRRVLCHELTHNVWGDHDNNFKELNSLLNKEVAEFEAAAKAGTHTLSGDGPMYEPSTEAEAHSYILGGVSGSSGSLSSDTREAQRRRILEATMNRLQKEEAELEQSCGTAGPSNVH